MQREPEDLEPGGEWRRDPTGRNGFRFWDGNDWTDRVSNFGVRSVDPMNGSTTLVAEPPKVKPPKVRAPKVKTPNAKPPKVEPPKVKVPKVKAPKVKAPRTRKEPREKPPRQRRERRRASTSGRLKTAGGAVVLLGATAAAVGTIVPLQPGPDTTNYLHSTDGAWIALTSILVAFVALFGILSRQSSRLPAIAVVVIGVGMVAVVYPDYQDLHRAVADLDWTSGIVLGIVGAFVVVAGGVIAIVGQTQ